MGSLNRNSCWLAGKIGFSTGIGIVAWGVGWPLWAGFNYFAAGSETELPVLIGENYSTQALLASVLIALGVPVMGVEKPRRNR